MGDFARAIIIDHSIASTLSIPIRRPIGSFEQDPIGIRLFDHRVAPRSIFEHAEISLSLRQSRRFCELMHVGLFLALVIVLSQSDAGSNECSNCQDAWTPSKQKTLFHHSFQYQPLCAAADWD